MAAPAPVVIKVSAVKTWNTFSDAVAKSLTDNPEIPVIVSGLGSAINTAITVTEQLKSIDICVIKKVETSLFDVPDAAPKPKIDITVVPGSKFLEAVARKQQLAEEKRRLRELVDQGRERAYAVFKAMTTGTPKVE